MTLIMLSRIMGSRDSYCSRVALSKTIVLTTAHCAVPGFQYTVNAIDSVPLNIRVKASYPDFDVTVIRAHRATESAWIEGAPGKFGKKMTD